MEGWAALPASQLSREPLGRADHNPERPCPPRCAWAAIARDLFIAPNIGAPGSMELDGIDARLKKRKVGVSACALAETTGGSTITGKSQRHSNDRATTLRKVRRLSIRPCAAMTTDAASQPCVSRNIASADHRSNAGLPATAARNL